MGYLPSILFVIAANAVYHLSQKSIRSDVHPLVSILTSYVVAIVLTLSLFVFYPISGGMALAAKKLNWASFTVGLSAFGLELGFLLAYRAGWNLNMAALYCNVAVAILLIPISLVIFHEKLSGINILGIILAATGLILMSFKKV